MTDYDKLTRGELISLIRDLKAAQTSDSGPVAVTSADFPVFGEREQRHFDESLWPIRIFDRETLKYLAVNDAALKLYGYTREEFLALSTLDIRHPEEHADHYDTLAEHTGYLRHKGPRRHLKKSGEIIVVEVVMQDILFNGRNARLSFTLDVTERIRMQELLRQREQEFESLAENLPDLVARFDRASRYVYVNAAVEKLTGRGRADIIGRTQRELGMPQDIIAAFDESFSDVFATGRSHTLEFRYPAQDGERLFEAVHEPETDPEGKVRTVLCVARDITARKRAEQAVYESESRLRLAVQAANIGLWDWDIEHNIVYFLPEWKRQLGYREEEISSRYEEWQSRLHADDRERALEVMRRCHSGSLPRFELEFRLRHKDGSYRWIHSRAELLRGAGGEPQRMVGCHIDLTERKHAEEQLRRREEESRALAENAPDIIVRFDQDLRHVYVNPAVAAATGLARETFIGKTSRELDIPRELVRLWEKNLREVFNRGKEKAVDFACPTVHGTRYFEARVVPEFGVNGKVATVLSIARDITKRKKAEDEVRGQKKLLDAVIDNLPVGVFIKDAKTLRFVIRNSFAERAFGYPLEDPIGKTVYDLFPKEQADSLWKSDREAVEKGRMVEISEQEMIGISGDIRIGHVRKVPIFGDDGEPWLLVGIADDITDRKRAEAALRESEERFRALAENIRDVFWINTASGDHLSYVSPAYEEIWGRDCDSLYRNPYGWPEAVHPEDVPAVKTWLAAMAVGEQVRMEYRIVRPDGAVRWIRDRSYPMKCGDGTQLACGVAEDITGYKRAEAERLAAERHQRDALVREVHHRIKNNLQGVVGLLRQLASEHQRVRPMIDKAVAQLQAIAVVHGLQAHGPESAIWLRDMIIAIGTVLRSMLNVEIRLDFGLDHGASLVLTETEAVPVALVLNELMTNAARRGKDQAGSDGVRVTVRGEMETVRVTISNPGRLPRRFDFATGRGIGTGLELVKSLLPQRGVRVKLSQAGERVNAEVEISPPVLMKQRSSALVFQQ